MPIGVNFWTIKNIWFHILNEVAVPLYKRCWFMPHDTPLFFNLRLIYIRQKKHYLSDSKNSWRRHRHISIFLSRTIFIFWMLPFYKRRTSSNEILYYFKLMYVPYFGFEMNLIQKVPKSPSWLNATIICKFNRKK